VESTTVLFIRHAAVDGFAQELRGRTCGVTLNASGRRQVQRLKDRLAGRAIAAVYSSPVRRAVETASALADRLMCEVHVDAALDEVEFGDWTGRSFRELHLDPLWHAFNTQRTTSLIPGAGSMIDVQARAVAWLVRTAAEHRGNTVLAVSHADVIRSVLAGCAGISLDLALRLDISPASISAVSLGSDGPRIDCINDAAHLESP
jgi:broad specificity phosphatase PhoE